MTEFTIAKDSDWDNLIDYLENRAQETLGMRQRVLVEVKKIRNLEPETHGARYPIYIDDELFLIITIHFNQTHGVLDRPRIDIYTVEPSSWRWCSIL